MTHKYMRTPSGSFIRPTVNRMVLNLKADPAPIDLSAFNIEPGLPADTSTSAPSYATKDFDITRLEGLEILIFGAGSVGGYILWALAAAQMIIHLFDSKKVESKHTQSGRTIYDSTQIGQFKVQAAKEKIERNFIGTTVVPSAYNVAEIPDIELIELFKKAVIVIVVIDDPAQILRLNRLCFSLAPMVQCGIHRQGRSSHIAFTIPQQTPCLACTLGISSQQDIRRLDSEPAAGIDISIGAQLAARIALDLLYSKVTQKPITRWDPGKNLLFISNTQQISPDGPGIEYDGSSQRRPDCSICH